MITRLNIETRRRCELLDITGEVERVVREGGLTDGLVVVYSPHTTAGITINENADPSVVDDMVMKLTKIIEHRDPDYCHGEGNSDSHIKTTLVGPSQTVIVEDGKLLLGTWQGIFFVECDGPRSRKFFVKTLHG
ncbi:MAG: YjbQ family protein [Deltaproteobacteria bacterium]|nr:YjbQ family protein [Deltaproteobacteria bacterium]